MSKHGHPADHVSYAFPITTSSILVLERRILRRILDWDGQRWVASIAHRDTSDDDLLGCRRAIHHGALNEVYGPTEEAVAFPTKDFTPTMPPIGPGLLLPHRRGRALLPYIEDYFRVLTLLESSPTQYHHADNKIDWAMVSRSWAGIVQVIVDMPRFPGGIALTQRAAYLDLGRFSIEDVEASLRRRGEDPTPPSTEVRPELRRLIEEDLRKE